MKIDIANDLKKKNMTKSALAQELNVARSTIKTWTDNNEIPDTFVEQIDLYFKVMGKTLPTIPNVSYEELAAVRRALGLPRKDVTDFIRIPLDHLNRYENGKINLTVFSKQSLINLYEEIMKKQGFEIGFRKKYDDIELIEYLSKIDIAASEAKVMKNYILKEKILVSNKKINYNCVFGTNNSIFKNKD